MLGKYFTSFTGENNDLYNVTLGHDLLHSFYMASLIHPKFFGAEARLTIKTDMMIGLDLKILRLSCYAAMLKCLFAVIGLLTL